MKNNKICISIYFNELKQSEWIDFFWLFVKEYFNKLNKTINYWGYRTSKDGKVKNGRKKINGEKKLNKIIEENKEQIGTLSVYSLYDDTDLIRGHDLCVSIRHLYPTFGYRLFYFETIEWNVIHFEFISNLLLHLKELLVMKYGIVTIMNSNKIPSLYFGNFATENISKNERSNLRKWRKLSKSYDKYIRDIYFGNILSISHFNYDKEKMADFYSFLQEYKVSASQIDGDLLFFSDERFLAENSELTMDVKIELNKIGAVLMENVNK